MGRLFLFLIFSCIFIPFVYGSLFIESPPPTVLEGDGIYLYRNGSIMFFNESRLNLTLLRGSDVSYGEMWNYTSGGWTFPVAAIDVYYNLTGLVEGHLRDWAFTSASQVNGGSYLTCLREGTYRIDWSFSYSAGANSVNGISAVKNFDVNNQRECYSRRTGAGSIGNVGGTCIMSLEENDTINLQVEDENNPATNLVVYTVNLNAIRLEKVNSSDTSKEGFPPWLYNDTFYIYFNESKLNDTIDSKSLWLFDGVYIYPNEAYSSDVLINGSLNVTENVTFEEYFILKNISNCGNLGTNNESVVRCFPVAVDTNFWLDEGEFLRPDPVFADGVNITVNTSNHEGLIIQSTNNDTSRNFLELQQANGSARYSIDVNGFSTWTVPFVTDSVQEVLRIEDTEGELFWTADWIRRSSPSHFRGHEGRNFYRAPTDNVSESGGSWFIFYNTYDPVNTQYLGIGSTGDRIGTHGHQNTTFIVSQANTLSPLPIMVGIGNTEVLNFGTDFDLHFWNSNTFRFYELANINYVGLSVKDNLSADVNFTLPSTDGTSGQALLTNGSAQLYFGDVNGSGGVNNNTHIEGYPPYLYDNFSHMFFNESKLNDTINISINDSRLWIDTITYYYPKNIGDYGSDGMRIDYNGSIWSDSNIVADESIVVGTVPSGNMGVRVLFYDDNIAADTFGASINAIYNGGDKNQSVFGIRGSAADTGGSGDTSEIIGIYYQGLKTGTGDTGRLVGDLVDSISRGVNAGDVDYVYGVLIDKVENQTRSSPSVIAAYSLFVNAPNFYTEQWAIYQNNSGQNYFDGNLSLNNNFSLLKKPSCGVLGTEGDGDVTCMSYVNFTNNHSLLTDLGNDSHPQYTEWAGVESITGLWNFDYDIPLYFGSNLESELVFNTAGTINPMGNPEVKLAINTTSMDIAGAKELSLRSYNDYSGTIFDGNIFFETGNMSNNSVRRTTEMIHAYKEVTGGGAIVDTPMVSGGEAGVLGWTDGIKGTQFIGATATIGSWFIPQFDEEHYIDWGVTLPDVSVLLDDPYPESFQFEVDCAGNDLLTVNFYDSAGAPFYGDTVSCPVVRAYTTLNAAPTGIGGILVQYFTGTYGDSPQKWGFVIEYGNNNARDNNISVYRTRFTTYSGVQND